MKYEVIVIGAGHAGCEASPGLCPAGLRTALVTMNMRPDLPDVLQSRCRWHRQGSLSCGRLMLWAASWARSPTRSASSSACSTPAAVRRFGRPEHSATRSSIGSTCGSSWSRSLISAFCRPRWRSGCWWTSAEPRRQGAGVGVRLRGRTHHRREPSSSPPGTFLNGLAHVGESKYRCGRNGEAPSEHLGDQLRSSGLAWTRLKTGTPRGWTVAQSTGRGLSLRKEMQTDTVFLPDGEN
jgi:tRNA uridine 5-carboxymethylaminomethyl modification enzyme